MSTRKRIETATEREGVNYVRGLVERANCIFHEIHRENDFGNDGIIEFVENEDVKGVCIAVQIKSGDSYCDGGKCCIPADRAHFEYWDSHSLPIIGIVYDPSEGIAYWKNITAYLANDRQMIFHGPYTITFAKEELSRLDNDTFSSIFMPVFLKRPIIFDFDKSLQWATDDDYNKHSVGLASLMYGHKDRSETWDVFFALLRQRPPTNTNPELIYFLALIPGHMDIFWSPSNRVNDEIRGYASQQLGQFRTEDVIKLLSYIDAAGVGRGTVGQCVIAILGLIADRRQILEEIALDKCLDFDIRAKTIPAFLECEPKGVARFLSRLLGADDQMRDHARSVIRGLGASEWLETE